jgi:hypothetical protein
MKCTICSSETCVEYSMRLSTAMHMHLPTVPVCLECARSREFLSLVFNSSSTPHHVFPEIFPENSVGGLGQPIVITGNCLICGQKTAFKALGQSLCLNHLDPYGVFVAAVATYGLIYEILSAWTYFGKPSAEQLFRVMSPTIKNLESRLVDIPRAMIADLFFKTIMAAIDIEGKREI